MRLLLFWIACALPLSAPLGTSSPPPLSDAQLLTEVQRRAVRFFWEKADPSTGLVNDRARNDGVDNYTISSIASTGYALAALPIAVERKWIGRTEAQQRATKTLRFLLTRMPHVRGWFHHFVDRRTGRREWRCEVSTIDTGLLVCGALVSGQYFGGGVKRMADALYARLDWRWMLTNGGSQPGKRLLSHGWKPEEGFLKNDWAIYDEGPLLYLLGMGAKHNPLPAACWSALTRQPYRYAGIETLTGGPIFLHQMVHGYFDFREKRDRLGYDYWVCSVNATRIHRQFCIDRSSERKTYGPDIWGLNASDGPQGYRAYGVPEPEDGTVSPTGALASIVFTPQLSKAAARAMYRRFGSRIWGRYGFANAFNRDVDWYGPDVIGIDLGMALVAVENHRSGLIWRLFGSHPVVRRGLKAAGFHPTQEPGDRPLRREPHAPKRWPGSPTSPRNRSLQGAVSHAENVICVGDHFGIVGDDDYDALFPVGSKEIDHHMAIPMVEGGRWLVGEDDIGVVHHCAGDADALALSAGKMVRVAMGQRRDVERLKQRIRAVRRVAISLRRGDQNVLAGGQVV